MSLSNPKLALAILSEAKTGRPIVLSKGIGDAWQLQCNGIHFIQDPTNKHEVAAVEKTINELADAGYLRDEAWVGANKNLYLTAAGDAFMNGTLEELAKQKPEE